MPATIDHSMICPSPRKRAIGWLLFLGAFFFASYGFSNWLASTRTDVGSIVFGWESHIPFLSWTIVPYWSIDLLYAVSLFTCASRSALDSHAQRLLLAQILAVPCFLLAPLHFTFERPVTDGLVGAMFDVLMGFDRPYNQAPSLHIALLVILWTRYATHIAPRWRWALDAWFALIGISVLTTYQHHFVDVPTGVWLGWLCVWAIPEHGRSPLLGASLTRDPMRLRLAVYYTIAGVALLSVALAIGGWALWLIWASGSLLMVASIYAFLDSAGFQKNSNGTMSIASLWLLAPYIMAAWINSRLWTRRSAAPSEIVPGLWIGRVPASDEHRPHGIRAMVDLAAELPCPVRVHDYASIAILDLVVPTPGDLDRAVTAIDTALNAGPTLVCCALGYSRSAMVVAAWLIATRRAGSPSEAIELVRRARRNVVLNTKHVTALHEFAAIRPLPGKEARHHDVASLENEWTAGLAAALGLGARWLAGASLVIAGVALLILWISPNARALGSTTLSLVVLGCMAQLYLIVRVELDRQIFDRLALHRIDADAALEVLDRALTTLGLHSQRPTARSLHDRTRGMIALIRIMGYIFAAQLTLAVAVPWILL